MTTRPTDTPEWATTGTIVEPAAAKQAAGWDFEDRPPFGWVNWAWSRFALWASHFASTASRVSLDGAFAVPATAPLAIGDTLIVVEPGDYSGIPGERDLNVGGLGLVFARSVVALGRECLYSQAGKFEAFARDGSGSLGSYPNHTIGGVVNFSANDVHVVGHSNVVSPANNVEIYDRATKTQILAFSAGAATGEVPKDIALGRDFIFVALTNQGNGFDLEAYNYAGVLQWQFDHAGAVGEGVSGVAVFGRYLYAYGAVSTHPSGATLRAIESTNGFGITAEGGLGVSTLPSVWDSAAPGLAVLGSGPGPYEIVKSDGRILVVSDVQGTTVFVLSPGDASLLRSWSVARLAGIELDNENVYVSSGGDTVSIPGRVDAHVRGDLFSLAWSYESTDPTFSETLIVSSDGSSVFLVDRGGAFGTRSPRLHKRNDPRLWTKVDPTVDLGLPHRRGVI